MAPSLISLNPSTGKELQSHAVLSANQVREKIQRAKIAFEKGKLSTIAERINNLRKLANYLSQHKEELAKMATLEMGKPFKQSVSEVEKCAFSLHYYADNGADFLQSEWVETEAKKSFVSYRPLGVVLAIMPWNFPYWQAFRALGPILLAGNTMLLKHASNVSGCALLMEKAVREAALPNDIFQVLLLPSSEMEAVITHPDIQAITLTGSTSAGGKVASLAAAHLKKQVLELGGSDPYLIFKDADIDLAVSVCVQSRLINSGQSCIAAKRFIVVKEVAEEFTKKMTAVMKVKKFGDPFDPEMDIGPMARADLRDDLHEQVRKSITLGAQCLCGGEIPKMEGAFYPPTVLTKVQKGMPAYEEELFGPVAAIIEVKDEEEAIKVANDTEFGLGAAIFSRDIERAEKIAVERIEAGNVFINQLVSSNPKLPFGGIKKSGYGRELSYFAVREFSNIKTISICES